MLTLQRSPWILCADMLDQVNFEKYPTLPDFGPRNLSRASFLLQCDRMDQQIGGSLLQGEGAHGYVPATVTACSRVLPEQPTATQV